MGLCLCGEEYEDRRHFRQVPFPNSSSNGGRDHVPPTFHHPHFRQVAEYHDKNYEQNEPYDPRSPYGSKMVSGENTRISGAHYENGGSAPIRREPGQIPSGRPDGINYGNAPIDMQRTEVYRQGNEKQTQILKTPRGNTGRGGTPRTGGRGGGGRGSRTTPRAGMNDPYNNNENDGYYDDEDDNEMILICADCYCDVMDESCPKVCAVTGKMHV